MTKYETWEEFPSCRLEPITATDAPPGVVLVLVEEYDRLRETLDNAQSEAIKIVERLKENWIKRQYEWSAISWADKVTAADQIIAALQEAGNGN